MTAWQRRFQVDEFPKFSEDAVTRIGKLLGTDSQARSEVMVWIENLARLARAISRNQETRPLRKGTASQLKALRSALDGARSKAASLDKKARIALGKAAGPHLRAAFAPPLDKVLEYATPPVLDFAFSATEVYCVAAQECKNCRGLGNAAGALRLAISKLTPSTVEDLREQYRPADVRRATVGPLKYCMNALDSLAAACERFQPRGRQRPGEWLHLVVGTLAGIWELTRREAPSHTWKPVNGHYAGKFRDLVCIVVSVVAPGQPVPDGVIKRVLAARSGAYRRPVRSGRGPR